MGQEKKGASARVDRIHVEMMGVIREPMAGQRWVSTRQQSTWCPPTDVYETEDCVVVKVEIAGMEERHFAISLDAKMLTISGSRYDSAAKLGYQQMEIPYGHFETHVQLTRAIDEEGIEATYHNGFLMVQLPKASPHQVPVVSTEDSDR